MTASMTRIPARRLDQQAAACETREAWARVVHLGSRIQTAVIAQRDDVIHLAGAELVHFGRRRLAQIGGGPNDAA